LCWEQIPGWVINLLYALGGLLFGYFVIPKADDSHQRAKKAFDEVYSPLADAFAFSKYSLDSETLILTKEDNLSKPEEYHHRQNIRKIMPLLESYANIDLRDLLRAAFYNGELKKKKDPKTGEEIDVIEAFKRERKIYYTYKRGRLFVLLYWLTHPKHFLAPLKFLWNEVSRKSNIIFLLFSISFAGLAFFRIIFQIPDILFESVDGYSNRYGLIALTTLLFFFILEWLLPISHLIGSKSKWVRLKELPTVAWWIGNELFEFVGFREVRQKRQVIIGLIAGLVLPAYIFLFSDKSFSLNIFYSFGVILTITGGVFTRVVLAPFIEEVFFRGMYINRFMSIFKNKTTAGLVALFSSALIFASIHTPEHNLLNMFIGGLVFGLVYLINWGNLREPFNWQKNIVAAIIAHGVSNFMVTVVMFPA